MAKTEKEIPIKWEDQGNYRYTSERDGKFYGRVYYNSDGSIDEKATYSQSYLNSNGGNSNGGDSNNKKKGGKGSKGSKDDDKSKNGGGCLKKLFWDLLVKKILWGWILKPILNIVTLGILNKILNDE